MPAAAEIMVRESKGLKEAVTDLSVPLTSQECATILRRISFQNLLRQAKIRFRAEVANAPGRNKTAAIGQLQILADNLEAQGDHDKAAEVLFKLAKLEGWVGEGNVTNVFGGLSQKDIDILKKQVEKRIDSGVSTAGPEQGLTN